MSIIKTKFGEVSLELSEWPEGARRIRIHSTNDYVDTLDRYQKLHELAKRDFPQLSAGDVTPVILSGMVHNGMVGIEFEPPEGCKVPKKYLRVGTTFPDPRR